MHTKYDPNPRAAPPISSYPPAQRKLGSRSPPAAVLVRHALFAGLLCVAPGAYAHHSYAMFDLSKPVVVRGSVAKVEWTNPHVFVWVYVEKTSERGKYDLYAFETDGTVQLMHRGWTKQTLSPGEAVRIQYFPLRDGRPGGELIRAIHADGHATEPSPLLPGASLVPDIARQAAGSSGDESAALP